MRQTWPLVKRMTCGQLQELVAPLRRVRGLPAVLAARRRSVGVDDRAAVDVELLQRLGEDVGGHPGAARHLVHRLGARPGAGSRSAPARRLGVVALVEKLVRFAVDEGVDEDRARGLAVAAGAADLLVVALDARGQRGVHDGPDVGLVDAHAEGDGGDDDVELAAEEAGLHAVALRARPCPRGRRRAANAVGQLARQRRRRPCATARRRWPASLAAGPRSASVASARSPGLTSTTSMARLSRRNPWMKRVAPGRPSCARMSSWTMGVAVAVRAMTGAAAGGAAAAPASGSRGGNRAPTARCSAPRRWRSARASAGRASPGTPAPAAAPGR